MSTTGEKSFVIFPLGTRRFAFPAEEVTELAKPDLLQVFPHRTAMLAGVLVRRGRIIPVLDVAQVLVGPDAPPRKFYLIVNRQCGQRQERTAIPVTGECELSNAEFRASSGSMPRHVTGFLSVNEEVIEVVALEKLIFEEATA
ncbi:MAG TPA: chemotaxis protein CheW [Candidatus Angelobacter sp.]|jgi:chemotaxis signal transduction protein|nr:chemotaxis protein CheW [Candidatus Angelobacter sp.]